MVFKKIITIFLSLAIIGSVIANIVLATSGTKNVNSLKDQLKTFIGSGWSFWNYQVSENYLTVKQIDVTPKDLTEAKVECTRDPTCIAVYENDSGYTFYSGKRKNTENDKYYVKLKPTKYESGTLYLLGEKVSGNVTCDTHYDNGEIKCIQVPPQFPNAFSNK